MPPAVDPGCRFSVDRLSPIGPGLPRAGGRASFALIAALALALASPGFGDAADSGSPSVVSAILADFEDAEELARWELAPTPTPMRWELDTDRVRHGRASARLVVQSVSEGGVSADDTWKGRGWPAIHLTGEKLPVRDWSPYRHLVFEAFNPAERPVHLWIRLGNHPKLEQVVLQPGWQTLRVDVDHVFGHRRAALLLRRSPAENRDQPRPRPSSKPGTWGTCAGSPDRDCRAHPPASRRSRGPSTCAPTCARSKGSSTGSPEQVDADRRGRGRSRSRALGGTGAGGPKQAGAACCPGQGGPVRGAGRGTPAGGTAGPMG